MVVAASTVHDVGDRRFSRLTDAGQDMLGIDCSFFFPASALRFSVDNRCAYHLPTYYPQANAATKSKLSPSRRLSGTQISNIPANVSRRLCQSAPLRPPNQVLVSPATTLRTFLRRSSVLISHLLLLNSSSLSFVRHPI